MSKNIVTEKEHKSICRISDCKLLLFKALAERKPEGLTCIEAATAFGECALYCMREELQEEVS